MQDMIITISGDVGSGKSTVAKIIAKKLGFKHYSTGDFMRSMAKEKKISLMQLGRLAEKSRTIDKELDERQKKLGMEKDSFVIDSRLGFHFIPNSKKVYLKVNDEIAAERIFSSKRDDEKYNLTLRKTLDNIKERRKSEIMRYKKYYGINLMDLKNYDIVIDTSDITAEEAADRIIKFVKQKAL